MPSLMHTMRIPSLAQLNIKVFEAMNIICLNNFYKVKDNKFLPRGIAQLLQMEPI